MIVRTEEVTQVIDGAVTDRFIKEVIAVKGPEPLAMVRKRLAPERLAGADYRAPLLLTHGFGQNRYAWHLSSRSFANHLAQQGFDVFNVDLRGHGRSRHLGSEGSHSVDDYILHDIPAAIDEVLSITQREKTFLLGHSLGGLIGCASAGLSCGSIAGIVAIGVPYRFTQGSLSLTLIARAIAALAGVGVFKAVHARIPVRGVGRLLHSSRRAWDHPSVPIPVRPWSPGSLEPALLEEYLLRAFDTASIGSLVQLAHAAQSGSFQSVDRSVDYGTAFEACNIPLLVIAGTDDRLAPPASVRPAYDRSQSRDKIYHQLPFGHADLLLGRTAPQSTWPIVTRWLDSRAYSTRVRGKLAS
jgi:polyhydroxyalkanoate synthase subunit PhaC